MPIILTFFLLLYNWREMFVLVGIITLIILLPLSWFFIKPHGPEYYGYLPDGVKGKSDVNSASLLKEGDAYAKEIGETQFTIRQAYRTTTLWLTAFAFSIHYFIIGVTNIPTINKTPINSPISRK